ALEGRRLLPQAGTEGWAQRLAILNTDRKTTARLLLERHVVTGDDGRRHSVRLATVLPLRGYERTATRLADLIAGLGGHRADESLLVVCCRLAGRPAPASRLGPGVPLRRDATAAAALGAVLARLRDHVITNEEGTRQQLDTEFLHDFRVAIRRARSMLKVAGGVLAPGPAGHLAGELQWLAGVTGPVRDLDVHLEELGPEAADDLDPLRQHLETLRRTAQADLFAGLGAP